MAEPWDDLDRPAPIRRMPRATPTPIVPKGSIAGRSLTAVVAIMTFLAALTPGAVMMVVSAASDWQSDVGARGHHPGAAGCRPRYRGRCAQGGRDRARHRRHRRCARLYQGGIGAARRAVARRRPRARRPADSAPDRRQARCPARRRISRHCASRLPRRCRAPASTIIAAGSTACAPWRKRRSLGGIAMLALVLVVTVLSVTFATRGAMATNRPIVEVLHYVGATDSFVASQFQRHFLLLGLKGGAIGGGAAIVLFGFMDAVDALACRHAGRRRSRGAVRHLLRRRRRLCRDPRSRSC